MKMLLVPDRRKFGGDYCDHKCDHFECVEDEGLYYCMAFLCELGRCILCADGNEGKFERLEECLNAKTMDVDEGECPREIPT